MGSQLDLFVIHTGQETRFEKGNPQKCVNSQVMTPRRHSYNGNRSKSLGEEGMLP